MERGDLGAGLTVMTSQIDFLIWDIPSPHLVYGNGLRRWKGS
jgi:hypothetical protein